jgi:hypothetical protein
VTAAADAGVARADAVGAAVRGEAERLAKTADEAVSSLQLIGETLQAQAREAMSACTRVAAGMAEVISGLRDEAAVVDGTTARAEERAATVGRLFQQYTEEIARASAIASENVVKVGEALQRQTHDLMGALTSASGQATEVGQVFREQAKTLASAAREAGDQAEIIRRNALDSRRDMFLRASKFVIEDLNSTAIDLNRLLDGAKSQVLWPKFAKGDRSVFVRGILSEDEREARGVIQRKFEGDEDFRRYVSRYLDHFEKLLSEANESDPESVLSSTFLSADVGKLYLLLARSVGRLN